MFCVINKSQRCYSDTITTELEYEDCVTLFTMREPFKLGFGRTQPVVLGLQHCSPHFVNTGSMETTAITYGISGKITNEHFR